MAFSPDGDSLATGSYDQTARIWDVRTGRQRHSLTGHHGAVMSVAYSPDGAALATASVDQTIRLWNAVNGMHRLTLTGHKSWVNSVAFSPDGKWLVSGSSDGTVKVWSIAGELLHTLPASKAEVRSVAVSPDGKHIAAGIRYGAVKVWKTADWQLVQKLGAAGRRYLVGGLVGRQPPPHDRSGRVEPPNDDRRAKHCDRRVNRPVQASRRSAKPGGVERWDVARGRRWRQDSQRVAH